MEKSINPLNGFHSLIFRLQNSPSKTPHGRINENQRDFPPRHTQNEPLLYLSLYLLKLCFLFYRACAKKSL